MSGESQPSNETDRPALSIIEGAGTFEGTGPGYRAPETKSTGRARKARNQPTLPTAEGHASSSAAAVDGAAISAEKGRALRKALEEFRTTLIGLVQESVPDSADSSVWRGSVFSLLRTTTSRSVFGRQLTPEELVGQYASLYPVLERPPNLAYAEMALFGILALKSGRNAIAQTVLEEVRFCTLASAGLAYVMRGVMRFTYAMAFIGFFALYTWFIFSGFWKFPGIEVDLLPKLDASKLGEMEITRVGLAALFGCLGGVVSLLMRLAEFDKASGKSKEFLMLSGGTQPLVGGIFAAVIASLIVSEIITISGVSHSTKLWLFVVVGFISGFSERFTRSMLSVAENRFSPASPLSNR